MCKARFFEDNQFAGQLLFLLQAKRIKKATVQCNAMLHGTTLALLGK
jgi:hypothetical protein